MINTHLLEFPYSNFHQLNLDWIIGTVKDTVNDWIATKKQLNTEWDETKTDWNELYNYVHNYFNNLDVDAEINNKLDEMRRNGQLLAVIASTVIENTTSTTQSWLNSHLNTGTTIDKSLTLTNAAAESYSAGHFSRYYSRNFLSYNSIYNIPGGYYFWDNTTNSLKFLESSIFMQSEKIPITPGDILTAYKYDGEEITPITELNIVFYDNNGDVVPQLFTIMNGTCTAPANAYWVSVPLSNQKTYMANTIGYTYDGLTAPVPFEPVWGGQIYSNLDWPISTIWSGKSWFAYGTSLTSTAQGKYANYVADALKLNLTNKGIPGASLVTKGNLYNAICNTTDGKLNADLITLEVGANDASAPLGDIYDIGTTTICGAINNCIQYLQQNCQKAQIVVYPSTPGRYLVNDPEQTPINPISTVLPGGYRYGELYKAISDICVMNGVYCTLNMSGLGGIRIQNNLYTADNIHQTDLGGFNWAQSLITFLRHVPLWYNALP